MDDSLISVVLSVFNGEDYLGKAIESILSQTWRNFEFIIVNDKSTDGTLKVLRKYAIQDKRIILVENDQNLGLAQSLNKGIDLANGKFIARMDADDVSLPDRFEKQINYLQNNPDIWVLGGNIKLIDRQGNYLRDQIYTQDQNILRWNMLLGYGGIICHPAVMMRKSIFDVIGKYRNIKTSQDLELWSRLFLINPLPISNLSDIVLLYRCHEKSISTEKSELQKKDSDKIHANLLERFMQRPVDAEVVNAYGNISFKYSLIEIRDYIQIWLEAYRKYVLFFKPVDNSCPEIFKKLLFRISCYVSISPINFFSQKRMCIWNELFLLKEIGILGILRVVMIKFSLFTHNLLKVL